MGEMGSAGDPLLENVWFGRFIKIPQVICWQHLGEADRLGPTQNSKVLKNHRSVFNLNFDLLGFAYVLRARDSQLFSTIRFLKIRTFHNFNFRFLFVNMDEPMVLDPCENYAQRTSIPFQRYV